MNIFKITVLAGLLALAGSAQDVRISVREVPPEPFPAGSCTQSNSGSGYLHLEGDSKEPYKLSKEQIGEYVLSRLGQGYSVTLYPQTSGRIFSVTTCESSSVKVPGVLRQRPVAP
jgi:hypothetical protein